VRLRRGHWLDPRAWQLSAGWITSSVRALRRLNPPNIGVVGPKVYGDGPTNKMHGGMTIDVVHRNHLAIFREYYPPALDNWYTDTWIVYVYVHALGDRKRSVKLLRGDNFSVMHSFEKRRYSPAKHQLKLLPALTECGRHAAAAFINATRAGEPHGRPVSCHAYASLPASTVERSCFRRAHRVGGLEMSAKEMQGNLGHAVGYCHERGPRQGLTAGGPNAKRRRAPAATT